MLLFLFFNIDYSFFPSVFGLSGIALVVTKCRFVVGQCVGTRNCMFVEKEEQQPTIRLTELFSLLNSFVFLLLNPRLLLVGFLWE